MINLQLISIALLSHALAVISPGPDFVLALKNAISYSRKTGIYTAVGFGLGIGVHILYSFLGLSYIISESPWVFNIIKYLGAIYIFYIGFQTLVSNSAFQKFEYFNKSEDISSIKAIRMGFLTNVLNPKASLFFLSLFTLILKSNPSNHTLTIIAFFLMLNTTIWFSLVAIFFNIRSIQKYYNNSKKTIEILLGLILILLSILIFLS